MKLAVMQPYFFPYLGYFQLIQSVEHFMFFDSVQYVKQSWMNRNRLLNFTNNEPYYIRVELDHPAYQAMLPTVRLSPTDKWKSELMKNVNSYRTKAPFFTETVKLIEGLLEKEYEFLTDFNIETTIDVARWLGIDVVFDRFSDYHFEFENKLKVGMWGQATAIAMKASHFINAPGGELYILPEGFTAHNIKLGFLQPGLAPYCQKNESFVSHLSIIDVLMFNGKEVIREHLNAYNIKWKN